MTRILAVGSAALVAAVVWSASAEPALRAQARRTTWDGVYNQTQATRGQALYEAHCGRCHNVDLTGVDYTPALTNAPFQANYDTLPVGTLFERFRVTMPLNLENTLSRQTYLDIVAYVLSRNGFPAGDKELPSDLGDLNQITFLATKP